MDIDLLARRASVWWDKISFGQLCPTDCSTELRKLIVSEVSLGVSKTFFFSKGISTVKCLKAKIPVGVIYWIKNTPPLLTGYLVVKSRRR